MKLYHFPSPDPRNVRFALLELGMLSKRDEQALPPALDILGGRLGGSRWMLGNDFSLVDCGYAAVLNAIEEAGFILASYSKVRACLDALRARPALEGDSQAPDARLSSRGRVADATLTRTTCAELPWPL